VAQHPQWKRSILDVRLAMQCLPARATDIPPQGCAPNARVPIRKKDYNEDVRYYTTKPVNGGTTFTCTFCEHSVTTLDFDNAGGNRRTKAAAAINQHAASLHVRPWVPAKLGVRGAL
jgi:hypothetical protein